MRGDGMSIVVVFEADAAPRHGHTGGVHTLPIHDAAKRVILQQAA